MAGGAAANTKLPWHNSKPAAAPCIFLTVTSSLIPLETSVSHWRLPSTWILFLMVVLSNACHPLMPSISLTAVAYAYPQCTVCLIGPWQCDIVPSTMSKVPLLTFGYALDF
eukprot:scaffold122755_cov18-Tisochrysis_lutea.AAC.1